MPLGTSTNEIISTAWETAASFSADSLAIFTVFVILILYTLYFGKGRMIALILSLYLSAFLYTVFPYTEQILSFLNSSVDAVTLNLLIFLAFVIISNVVIGRFVNSAFSDHTLYSWFEALLMGVSAAILLLALSYHVLPVSEVYDFSVYLDKLFEPVEYLFLWLLAPLLGLILVSRG